ncbi:SRPBCC family protein [Nocardioides perillae]|uniref:Uncharacterized protein YndB with AHSA1/START domain n=1 Tax=Nocardioides perillae TaxID=1119534 RepID=A0A7Y9UJD2_9ACTN|nr:uncharacterized protein YndB with AHSA1/START domain [Nocardioides perillae]
MASTTTRATKVVDRPIEQVWAALVDHEGMASWGPGLQVTLTTPGREERNGVGAVRRIAAPGPAPAIVEEVTECTPYALGYRALSGVPFKDYSGRVTLRDVGGRTEVTWALTARTRVAPEKLVLAGTTRALLAAFTRSLRRS